MVQIKITPKAKDDIKSIYDYIALDSYQNAEMVSEAMIRKIESIKRQSDLEKIVKEFSNTNIRELKLFKYRIIYRIISTKNVEVITIQHSSRLLLDNPHLKDFFE